ncbi:uncharacterized protein [Rutidosis leptorrhynchoides]|uniref:uncharacterized protein n=1 Tax=Rutidosis leptorrhynchoides TaxID=125765 RepID=UPI003A9A081A
MLSTTCGTIYSLVIKRVIWIPVSVPTASIISGIPVSVPVSVPTAIIISGIPVPRVGVVYWSLCLYSREIRIMECDALSSVIPSYTAGQRLKVEEMLIYKCNNMKEVFASTVENDNVCHSTIFDDGSRATDTSSSIPRLGNVTSHNLSILKEICISNCDNLEYIFTFSTLESLKKLEVIRIKWCKGMKVIVKEEGEQTTSPNKVVDFPRLKVIKLVYLSNLEGFFLGRNEFQWPLLNDVIIKGCHKMMAFTGSKSIARRLKYVEHATFGKLSPEVYNFYSTTASSQTSSPSLDRTTACLAISNDVQPRSLQDINELYVENAYKGEVIIASNELLQLQNLEKIHAKRCEFVEKMFEIALEVTHNEFKNESQIVVKLPKLRELDLEELSSLKYLWVSNQWGQLELPNLTRLCIHNCKSLEYVFTTSMVGSLTQLQELHVTHCFLMREIVKKDDDCEQIVLPCLKSLKLEYLRRLNGFCLWKKDFSLPLLSTLVIKQCPLLSVFTNGFVVAPELKEIESNEGLIDVGEQDINSFIITNKKKGRRTYRRMNDAK